MCDACKELFAYTIQDIGCLDRMSESGGQNCLDLKVCVPQLLIPRWSGGSGCYVSGRYVGISEQKCSGQWAGDHIKKGKGQGCCSCLGSQKLCVHRLEKESKKWYKFLVWWLGHPNRRGGWGFLSLPHYSFCLLSTDCLIYKQNLSWGGEEKKKKRKQTKSLVVFFPVKLSRTFN